MAKTIANLNIQVGAPTTEVKKGFRSAGNELKSLNGKVAKASTDFRKFGSAQRIVSGQLKDFRTQLLASVKAFTLWTLAIEGARRTFAKLTEQFDVIIEVSKLSQELGISTQRVLAFRLAAEETGNSVDSMTDSIKEFALRLGEADRFGTGTAIEGFQVLGLEAEKLADMKLDEAFLDVADAIAKLNDPRLQAFSADAIFGGPGQDMLSFLQQGREGFLALEREIKTAGGLFGDNLADQVLKADKALKEMRRTLDGLAREFAVNVAPAITDLAKALTEVLVAAKPLLEIFKSDVFQAAAFAGPRFIGGAAGLINRFRGVDAGQDRSGRLQEATRDEKRDRLLQEVVQRLDRLVAKPPIEVSTARL